MTWEDVINSIKEQGGFTPQFRPKAFEELQNIFKKDQSIARLVVGALIKISLNPLPKDMGGPGNRLGKNSQTGDLRPLLCVKLKNIGIRIVYALNHELNHEKGIAAKYLTIVVISKREDMEVYLEAVKRKPSILGDWPENWNKL